jgi:hypothetical protein
MTWFRVDDRLAEGVIMPVAPTAATGRLFTAPPPPRPHECPVPVSSSTGFLAWNCDQCGRWWTAYVSPEPARAAFVLRWYPTSARKANRYIRRHNLVGGEPDTSAHGPA